MLTPRRLLGAHVLSPVLAALLLAGLSACSAPRFDGATPEGKAAILHQVNLSLTQGHCTRAIADIEGLYSSDYTDNIVRLTRASAHGCSAGINLFRLIGDLGTVSLTGADLWRTFTQLFYAYDPDDRDRRVVAGHYAQDALFAALKTGTIVTPANRVNDETPNIGSVLPSDRIDDANAYLLFVSMASIGALQSRYGDPDELSWSRRQKLGYTPSLPDGWEKAANVDEDGCGYASSILNFVDTIGEISDEMQEPLRTTLLQVRDTFGMVLSEACNAGCRGLPALDPTAILETPLVSMVDFSPTGCTITDNRCEGTVARPCPQILRHRSSCKPLVANDPAACAAAGLAAFMNQHPLGWQP